MLLEGIVDFNLATNTNEVNELVMISSSDIVKSSYSSGTTNIVIFSKYS